MSTQRSGPVLARRRLATALRAARGDSTLEEVASALLISVSKLSRLEKGQGLPQVRDVRDLVNYYGLADSPEAEKLMNWAREGRRKGWWEKASHPLTAEQDQYIAHENEATVNRSYSSPFVHGLLQTEEYTRALITGFSFEAVPADELDSIVETRNMRIGNLFDRGPDQSLMELHVVMPVAVLSQPIGSSDTMKGQLKHLVKLSQIENIEIRVLEQSAGSHRAMISMWHHFSFGENIDRDVVFLESPTGYTQIEDERKTRLYHRWFDELRRRSLTVEQTRDRIQQFIDQPALEENRRL